MKICRVKKTNLYDVFVGEGWCNHVRIFWNNTKISFISKDSVRLTNTQIQKLYSYLNQET